MAAARSKRASCSQRDRGSIVAFEMSADLTTASDSTPAPDFDAAFYLAAYPDVAAAGLDPYEHYRLAGRAELRLPRPETELVAASGLLDPNYYLINAADVLEAGADP